MKLTDYKGFEVHLPTSGGKAGTGFNKTSTIQVRKNSMIVKQFRFYMADNESQRNALRNARAHIDQESANELTRACGR